MRKYPIHPAFYQLDPNSWVAQGLLSWWGFFEGAGVGVRDWSHYGNHGILEGAANQRAWVPDEKNGYAIDFDGSNDNVNVGPLHWPASTNITNLTITALVYWDNPLQDSPQPRLIAKSDATGINMMLSGWNGASRIRCQLRVGDSDRVAYSPNGGLTGFQDWILAALTWDGANIYAWLDGVIEGNNSAVGALTLDASKNTRIADHGESADEKWVGPIADVRIWDRTLTGAEMLEIRRNPLMGLRRIKQNRYFLPTGAPPVTNIDPEGMTQAQALDVPTLGYLVFINADATSQGQTLDEPAVSVGATAIPDALQQLQSLAEPNIDVRYFVAADALVQSQSLDEPGIGYLVFLATDPVTQNQSLAEPVVFETVFLVPDSLVQGQTLEEAIVVPEGAVVALSITQAQALDEPGIGYDQIFDPDALTQAQTLDEPTVIPIWQILADDVSQPQNLDEVTVVAGIVISSDPVTQTQTVDEVSLLVRKDLAPDFMTQAQRLDSATVFVPGVQLSPLRRYRIKRETRGWKILK